MTLAWQKVAPNRWERPADGFEGYFIFNANASAKHSGTHQHYALFSTIKLVLDLPDITAALKNAWKQMRYEHPQIATWVEGMTKVYLIPDEDALNDWMASTFIISSATDAEELYMSIGLINQATLYWLPKSSQIVLRAPHHTIDGMGVLMLWHCFLKALSSPMNEIVFGDETARLAPAIAEILGQTTPPSPQQLEQAGALFMDYAGRSPGTSIGPVSKVGTVPAGRCRQARLTLSAETTKAVIEMCKSRGFSLTSAIHAAYIGTVVEHADPDTRLEDYVSMNQFNLRRFLPEPPKSSERVVGLYYISHPYHLDLPASYDDIANDLHKYYHSTFDSNPALLELAPAFTAVACGACRRLSFRQARFQKLRS